MFFTNLFILLYKNNNQSVQVSNYFDVYRCYGNKYDQPSRLKVGNLPFWSKIERIDREINTEHKQIPLRYCNKR